MKPVDEISVVAPISPKGGVGRSTVAVGLAAALCRRGARVLLCDLDGLVRQDDLLLGLENRALFGLSDLASGKDASSVLLTPEGTQGLMLCPAPDREELPENTSEALLRAASENDADYLILDPPARGQAAEFALMAAGTLLIVTSCDARSVLAAEVCAESTAGMGKERLLVINRFDAENGTDGTEISPDGIIDRTRVRLVGIVCESESLVCRANEGKLALFDGCDRCFDNIAARLQKEDVPLFDGMKDEKRKRRLLRRS